MAQTKYPPLMHFALALRALQEGYAIRRRTWDGSQGGHELAWLVTDETGGFVFYANASGLRLVRQTHISGGSTVDGDVVTEDMKAWDWTILRTDCDFTSECSCGDAITLGQVTPLPGAELSETDEMWFDIEEPQARMGILGCDGVASSDCECYEPVDLSSGDVAQSPQPDPATYQEFYAAAGAAGGEWQAAGDGSDPGGDRGGDSPNPGGTSGGGGNGGGSPSTPKAPRNPPTPPTWTVEINLTRALDDLVPCDDQGLCPQGTTNGWFGDFTLHGPDTGNLWSYKVKRGGTILATGTCDVEQQVTIDQFAHSGAPGSSFPIQVVCNELLGDNEGSGQQTCLFPQCACNTCAEGWHWDPTIGDCIEDNDPPDCPPGQVWDGNINGCRPECGSGEVYYYDTFQCEEDRCPGGTWNYETEECE